MCHTSLPFIIDFTHKGMAYKVVIYSYHIVSHLFKTKLNEKDCVKKKFIRYNV